MSDRLCVVMPVYNEQDAIGAVLEKWAKALDSLGIDYAIRPYNDGSKDNSLAVMKEKAAGLPRVEVRDKPNGGHGNTILTGYRDAARDGFDWIFQIDSDDEMGPEKFNELWSRRNDNDFLVGIRDGRVQALPRKVISFVSRLCVRIFYGKSVWDVNTPYRLMRVSAFDDFYAKIPLTTFAPNVILSGLAARHKLRCFETRVPQHDRTTGEVSIKKWKLLKAALRSFWQTIWFSIIHVKSIFWLLTAVIVACIAICLLKSPLLYLPYGDEQVYNMAGKVIARGGVMYRDFFDHKGPVFHFLNGLGWMIHEGYIGPWIVFSAVHIISVCVLFLGVLRLGGAWRASFSCIIVSMIPYLMDYPESLVFDMSVLAIGALCICRAGFKAMVIAGSAAAVSFLSKQTNIGCFVGIGAWLVLNSVFSGQRIRSLKLLGTYLLSGVLVIALAIVGIWLFWDVSSWWNCTFRYNSFMATGVTINSIHSLLLVLQGTSLYWMLAFLGILMNMRVKERRAPALQTAVVAWGVAVAWEFLFQAFQQPFAYHWTTLMLLLVLPLGFYGIYYNSRKMFGMLLFSSLLAFLPVLTRSFTNAVHLIRYGKLLLNDGRKSGGGGSQEILYCRAGKSQKCRWR